MISAGLEVPDRSPSPPKVITDSNRIGAEEDIDTYKGLTEDQIKELIVQRESKANAQILEMVGDIPDADAKPPENVLFVCKLNPVTTDEDLEIIFSRFGTILSCEVIRDQKTGDSLQYAFIEFENEEDCIKAYFKMDNVLIDDRRIHVDFSQSLAKVKGINRRKYSEDNPEGENRKKNEIKDDGLVAKKASKEDGYEMVFGGEGVTEVRTSVKHKRREEKSAEEDEKLRRRRKIDGGVGRRNEREGKERGESRRYRDEQRSHRHHRRSRSRSHERYSGDRHWGKHRKRDEHSRSGDRHYRK